MSDKFAIRLQAVIRPSHSGAEPQLIVKGHHPLIVITPDIEDKNPDQMTVNIDATGFEAIELAAFLRSLSDTILDGANREVTPEDPNNFDWADVNLSADDRNRPGHQTLREQAKRLLGGE